MDSENKNSSLSGAGKERRITLSPKMYKFAIASLGLGSVLFLGTCGYSIYSFMNQKNNQAAIYEMQEAAEHQQEQLTNLSKKATELSEQLQNLTRMETELRIQAGLKPPKDVEEKKPEDDSSVQIDESANLDNADIPTESAEAPSESLPNGQGGPIGELQFNDVKEAYSMLETDLNTRRESLSELQTLLKSQFEQMITGMQTGVNGEVTVTNLNMNFNKSVSSNVPSIWPVTGVVTSPYGLRWGGSDFHPGIDIANDTGTPIVATADGVVDYAGWDSGGYGNMVDINHGNGIMTRYGHASQVMVSTGQAVKRGQVIALMGSTGFSTGPHCHYEIHVNGEKVNPISYL